jgi:hypothetical protein
MLNALAIDLESGVCSDRLWTGSLLIADQKGEPLIAASLELFKRPFP